MRLSCRWIVRSLVWLAIIPIIQGGMGSPVFAQPRGFAVEPSEAELRSAVAETLPKLGELQPWQTTLFQEEVIPQYKRFIKDYRAAPEGLKVTVDDSILKQFLAFYAPTFFQKPKPQILILLKTDPGCLSCRNSITGLERLAKERAERRGFEAVFQPSSEFKFVANPFTLQGQLTALAEKKGVDATLLITWARLRPEAIESAHPGDENRYTIASILRVKDLPVFTRQQELLETGQFEVTDSRILTDIFAELGAKVQAQQDGLVPGIQVKVQDRKDVLIQISGIQNLAQYQRIRDRLQNDLRDIGPLEPRKFWEDSASLAIDTKMSLDELNKKVEAIALAIHTAPAQEPGRTHNPDFQIKVKVSVE